MQDIWQRTLGKFELTVVGDRSYRSDGGQMFGVVPKRLWGERLRADEWNRIPMGMNSLVVRTGAATVLIETGAGNKLTPRQMDIWAVDERRDFLERLAEAGFPADAIDVVINTHLHFDHCGWNTLRDAEGRIRPAFPRARYFVQRGEWERAREQHERDRISYLDDNYTPLVDSGRMTLLEGERELLPGVSVQVLSGHTRWMQAVLLRSAGETACYISDLIPTRWHLQPTWLTAFDLFPLETIANKHRVLDQAARERWLLFFTHDAELPWAEIERDESGKYRLRTG